jgi:hypothetical protein
MPQPAQHDSSEEGAGTSRIVLGLLQSVERDGAQSQRRIARELGVALGLVNLYIRRCVSKGLLKVAQAPAGRYAYYLTPQGFAEKSRLTVEFLSYSFSLIRQAKLDYARLFQQARQDGLSRVVLAGKSDLAEVAALCAIDYGIDIAAVVDPHSTDTLFLKLPVVQSFEQVDGPFDAVVVTDLRGAAEIASIAAARVGAERVLVPNLLGVQLNHQQAAL